MYQNKLVPGIQALSLEYSPELEPWHACNMDHSIKCTLAHCVDSHVSSEQDTHATSHDVENCTLTQHLKSQHASSRRGS